MLIEASGVGAAIGARPILHAVDFLARAGEVSAIVGPNGSGKTTLMRVLSGDLPYQGTVRLNGLEVNATRSPRMAALRAVLPQATALSFPFTVREVVRLGLTAGVSGVPRAELAALPDLALERVDLAGFAGRYYQELSGGEQQRVQLARVLCQVWLPVVDGEPRWLFLDEPVSSLDIRHQLGIMEIAADFARRGGGVVAVLHDLNLTAMFADRVTMMQGGHIAAAGAPAEIMRDDLLERVFDCALRVGVAPAGRPFILPQSAARSP